MSGRIWIVAGSERDCRDFMIDQRMPFVRGLVYFVTREQQLEGAFFEQQDAVYTLQSASWELKELVRRVASKNFYDLTKVVRNNEVG